jgi:hypothetical protein
LLNLFEDRKTQIGMLERLAVLCAALTFPEVIKDRQCVFFIDNTQALSACIHGYCRTTYMGLMCNLLYFSLAGLRCQPFSNWVPSTANPADLPSREEGVEERAFYKLLQAKPRRMRPPSFEEMMHPSMNLARALARKRGAVFD